MLMLAALLGSQALLHAVVSVNSLDRHDIPAVTLALLYTGALSVSKLSVMPRQ